MEPWNEEAHRNLMRVLASTGQRSAAPLQYRACVDCLTTELGVRPGIETQELYQRIRDNQPPVRPQVAGIASAPAQLSPQTIPLRGVTTMTPIDLTPMIGRERELEELTELLTSPDCRLISIVGMGGVGKSRLALALAATQRANYATTAFIPLTTVDDANDILPAVTTLVQPVLSHDTLDLRDHHPFVGSALLLLDNFEHLIPQGIPVLATLLTESPHLRCVITTRKALGAPWEWRFDLHELSYPTLPPGDERHYEDYGAIQMFLQVARRMRARHPIQPNEMSQVARICQLVGGMPLGIEFAAAQVGRLPLSKIADQVASQLETLEAMPNELPDRQQSLRASFESSWRTLSSEEQRAGVARRRARRVHA
ncbi:MAG: hypothetical protein IPK16_24285 [Anaerolineales bacterium]|nr:hypothetical protein [Anaerolineales bacterium]